MDANEQPTCRLVRPSSPYRGKQGLDYDGGISRETVGSKGLCMHRLTLQPGDRAKAHLHENHETAIYALAGTSEMWFGSELQHHLRVRPGDMVYIPAGVPHLPMNPFDEPATVVLSRTDPSEQESVVLLPELERFGP